MSKFAADKRVNHGVNSKTNFLDYGLGCRWMKIKMGADFWLKKRVSEHFAFASIQTKFINCGGCDSLSIRIE